MMKLPSLLVVVAAITALVCSSHADEYNLLQIHRLGRPVIQAKKPYVYDAKVVYRQRKGSKSASKAAKEEVVLSSSKTKSSKNKGSKSDGSTSDTSSQKEITHDSNNDAQKNENKTIGTENKSEERLNNISLGNKRHEGIAAGPGDEMFVSEVLFGGVKKVNVKTGETEQVVPSFPFVQRGGVGLAYHDNALFVAGGGNTAGLSIPAMLYVYDVETGKELAKCFPPNGEGFKFLNAVTVVENYAYVTDWELNKLMVVDVKAALDGDCVVDYIETPAEYFLADPPDTIPRASGIVGYGNGLVLGRTSPGGLYFMNLNTKETIELADPEDAPSNDGLAIADDLLYSAENTFNTITVWNLKGKDNVSAKFEGRIYSDDFDFPAKITIYGDYICAVNTRLNSLPLPDKEEASPNYNETFYMTCVDRFDFD